MSKLCVSGLDADATEEAFAASPETHEVWIGVVRRGVGFDGGSGLGSRPPQRAYPRIVVGSCLSGSQEAKAVPVGLGYETFFGFVFEGECNLDDMMVGEQCVWKDLPGLRRVGAVVEGEVRCCVALCRVTVSCRCVWCIDECV